MSLDWEMVRLYNAVFWHTCCLTRNGTLRRSDDDDDEDDDDEDDDVVQCTTRKKITCKCGKISQLNHHCEEYG